MSIEYMPVLTDVNAYFDARLEVTPTSWGNLMGEIDFELFAPISNEDGVEVVGSETSYGKFTKPWSSGSSRTWYFVFRNIGGVYTNWRAIVGNECDTYKCSTISMDANGYLKFTRPDIIPSTSLGYKCSDWHVVAWVSDASTSRTKLWIDGVYMGYASNMQGWADDTYLCRGSAWWYPDNNTVFRGIAIADSAHADADVVTNSRWLYDYYITNYGPIYAKKYLVRKAGTLYTVADGAIVPLEAAEVSAAVFREYGLDAAPPWGTISGLIDPEVLLWYDTAELAPVVSATVTTGVPPQEMVCTADLSDDSIVGISLLTAEYSGTVLLSHCTEEGAWSDPEDLGVWITRDCDALYESLGEERLLHLKFILYGGATLTRFKITMRNS